MDKKDNSTTDKSATAATKKPSPPSPTMKKPLLPSSTSTKKPSPTTNPQEPKFLRAINNFTARLFGGYGYYDI